MTAPTPAPDRDGHGRRQTPTSSDPAVVAFLALLAARRAPRTVDAYRRDLADLGRYLGKAPGEATADEIMAWLADLRGRGQATTSVARRAAAARAFSFQEAASAASPASECARANASYAYARSQSPIPLRSQCSRQRRARAK